MAKSKQERVRLNQQRSRARRQEYLQSLEKRVLDSQSICREADLQRESYQQLCKENQKLRALLASLGIPDTQINAFVNADASNLATGQASLKKIRPKLPSKANLAQVTFSARLDAGGDKIMPPATSNSSSPAPSGGDSSCNSTERKEPQSLIEQVPNTAYTDCLPIPQQLYQFIRIKNPHSQIKTWSALKQYLSQNPDPQLPMDKVFALQKLQMLQYIRVCSRPSELQPRAHQTRQELHQQSQDGTNMMENIPTMTGWRGRCQNE